MKVYKNRLEKLEAVLDYHKGGCITCQRDPPICGGFCIPRRLIEELIDEEKKMIEWRKLR